MVPSIYGMSAVFSCSHRSKSKGARERHQRHELRERDVRRARIEGRLEGNFRQRPKLANDRVAHGRELVAAVGNMRTSHRGPLSSQFLQRASVVMRALCGRSSRTRRSTLSAGYCGTRRTLLSLNCLHQHPLGQAVVRQQGVVRHPSSIGGCSCPWR